MGRFILRYQGTGDAPRADLERFRALSGVSVLDDSPRMLLVDGPEQHVRQFVSEAPDWVMTAEKTYDLPAPHPSLKKARALKKPK